MNTLPEYPFPVQKLQIHDNIELAYMDTGKGKQTLLFLHGLANYAPVWKYQLKELSGQYRCIAVDLPGNGLSSRGPYPYSQFFYAECIKRFTDELQLNSPILAGHSMGGQIALMLSLRYPSVFRELILIAPAGIEYFSPTDKLFMQQILNLGDFFYADEFHLESAIRESFEHPGNDTSEIIRELKQILKKYSLKQWREMSVTSIRGMLDEQINKFLPTIEARTLLLFGAKDRLIPNRLLHAMDSASTIAHQGAALIPNSEMHLIADAGHFVHVEKHQAVNNHILKWLSV